MDEYRPERIIDMHLHELPVALQLDRVMWVGPDSLAAGGAQICRTGMRCKTGRNSSAMRLGRSIVNKHPEALVLNPLPDLHHSLDCCS